MQVLSDLNGPIEVKKYHPKMFVLDVSTEMSNLPSANANKPITGNVLKSSNLKMRIYNHKLHTLFSS